MTTSDLRDGPTGGAAAGAVDGAAAGTVGAAAGAAPSPAVSGGRRPSRLPRLLRGRVGLVSVVVLVLGLALLLGLLASGQRRGYLDPDGVDRTGGRAVVRVLEDQGVRVVRARRLDDAVTAAGPGSTVLVTVPDLLGEDQAARLRDSGADLVLVGPVASVDLFVAGAEALSAAVEELDPDCALAVADRAGRVLLGGTAYDLSGDTTDDTTGCYPTDRLPSLVQVRDGGRTVTLLGAPQPLTNEHLDTDGNAALALGLLGAQPTLVWYRPVLEEVPGQGSASIGELLPGWVGPVALQLLLAAALAGLWRGRRLGPLVREPLPVVVPAAEAVRGRARLYRRSGSRPHAAQVLRAATLARLRRALALPAGAPNDGGAGSGDADVVSVVAARTGRGAAEVSALLVGPSPPDDAALVRLARDLDRLETEVRLP